MVHNIKNKAILRDFLNFQVDNKKQSTSARLLSKKVGVVAMAAGVTSPQLLDVVWCSAVVVVVVV